MSSRHFQHCLHNSSVSMGTLKLRPKATQKGCLASEPAFQALRWSLVLLQRSSGLSEATRYRFRPLPQRLWAFSPQSSWPGGVGEPHACWLWRLSAQGGHEIVTGVNNTSAPYGTLSGPYQPITSSNSMSAKPRPQIPGG